MSVGQNTVPLDRSDTSVSDEVKQSLDKSANEAGKKPSLKRSREEYEVVKKEQENPEQKRKREEDEGLNLQIFIKNQPISNHTQTLYNVFGIYGISMDSPIMILGPKDVDLKSAAELTFGCSFRPPLNSFREIRENCPQKIASTIFKCKMKSKIAYIEKVPQFIKSVKQLVSEKQDEIFTIWKTTTEYYQCINRTDDSDSVMREEFRWWTSPILRKYALFRRLLLPMQHIVNHSTHPDDLNNAKAVTRYEIRSFDFSLMQFLLQCDGLQILLLQGLLSKLEQLQNEKHSNQKSYLVKYTSHLRDLILDHIKSTDIVVGDFQENLRTFLSTIRDPNGIIHSELTPVLKKIIGHSKSEPNSDDHLVTLQPSTPPSVIDFPIEKKGNTFTGKTIELNQIRPATEKDWLNLLPPKLRKEEMKIRDEAQTLLHEVTQMQQNHSTAICRRSGRRPKMKNRASDGDLVFHSNQISKKEFIQRTKFMNRVNEKFQRRFTPGHSRPTMKGFQFSKETLNEIRNMFFDGDGSLRDSISNDIDISLNNDPRIISFGKVTSSSVRSDQRWQLTIRKHGLETKVATRTKLYEIYRRECVLSPDNDDLHEVAILIGGTEDQRLHHDVARQMAIWYKENLSVNKEEKEHPVTGWEVDRIPYNRSMESPFSPSSMLTALHESGKFLLGIQKDQIILDGDPSYCRIVGGCGSKFKIVRSNENLVVIVVPNGCIFSGDFPHCGVRNFEERSEEERLMVTCIEKIDAILKEIPSRQRLLRSQRVIQMLCKFPGLSKLCRLHSSSEMIEGPFRQPRNAVGFSYCQVNERDSRCKEHDSKISIFGKETANPNNLPKSGLSNS